MDHAFCFKCATLPDTWQNLDEILTLSFQALYSGKHPESWWLDTEPMPKRFQALAGKDLVSGGHSCSTMVTLNIIVTFFTSHIGQSTSSAGYVTVV